MNRGLARSGSVLIVGLLLSCATRHPGTNVAPLTLQEIPSVSARIDPQADFGNYRTFSIVPLTRMYEGVDVEPLLERQLLFFIRCAAEARGYRFVLLNEQPDFLLTGIANSRETGTPTPADGTAALSDVVNSSQETEWRPPLAPMGNQAIRNVSEDWGEWGGPAANTPGTVRRDTPSIDRASPAKHLTSAVVLAFDARTMQTLWTGRGTGRSHHPDVRISSQVVMQHVIRTLPGRQSDGPSPDVGYIGILFSTLTNDGVSYYPTVIRFVPGMPAHEDGMKRYDMITEIDGSSTRNRSFSEVLQMLHGPPGAEVVIKVTRLASEHEFKLKREAW